MSVAASCAKVSYQREARARAASRRSGACVDRIARMESRRIQTIQCATNAYSLTSSDAEDKNCERCNQSGRSQPMVLIPAMLLRLPVFRKGFRRPFGNPVVDGHRTDERKHDGEDLDCESDCGEAPRGLVQVLEGQQQ